MQQKLFIAFLFFTTIIVSQSIKSIQLRPLQENNFTAIVPLGTVLELSFDDLENDSKDYEYRIEHMTHDWQKSRLLSSQYIDGFDENTIINVTNSFNTFQSYTHYAVRIPNVNTVITKSGNYLLSVINYDTDEVVFTRRFVLYENMATIGVNVSRSRNAKTLSTQQTVEFTVNHPNIRINNPAQEVNVVLLKNENWSEKITDLQPTFFMPNQLKYTYANKTNFWGGNEYLFFDNKNIRNASVNIAKSERKEIYHNYLYPYINRGLKSYTYNPDINGQFIVRNIEARNPKTEADYAMMNFSLKVGQEIADKEVYVYGAFNNFSLTEENKMIFDSSTNYYNANFLLKQGFYNYTFVTKSWENIISETEIRGNFYETENMYTVIVYHKAFGALFDRVIGVGTIQFEGER
jgi:hypothetical protein